MHRCYLRKILLCVKFFKRVDLKYNKSLGQILKKANKILNKNKNKPLYRFWLKFLLVFQQHQIFLDVFLFSHLEIYLGVVLIYLKKESKKEIMTFNINWNHYLQSNYKIFCCRWIHRFTMNLKIFQKGLNIFKPRDCNNKFIQW